MLLLFRQETLVSYRRQAGPLAARPASKSNSLSAETIAEARAMGLLDGKVAVVTGAGSGDGWWGRVGAGGGGAKRGGQQLRRDGTRRCPIERAPTGGPKDTGG